MTALNQSITASDEGDGTSEQLTGLIEVNSDIQPGDSGGPLVDTSGQVVGMDTAASSSAGFTFQDATGQGYAIPIDAALTIAKQIEAGTSSSTVHIGATAFLGVEIQAPASGQGSTGARQAGAQVAASASSAAAADNKQLRSTTATSGRQQRHKGARARPASHVAGVVASSPAAEGRPGRRRRDHRGQRHDGQLGRRPHDRHDGPPPRRQGPGDVDGQPGQQHTATVTLATGPAD